MNWLAGEHSRRFFELYPEGVGAQVSLGKKQNKNQPRLLFYTFIFAKKMSNAMSPVALAAQKMKILAVVASYFAISISMVSPQQRVGRRKSHAYLDV